MKNLDRFKKKIKRYLQKEQLTENEENKKLTKPFLSKARKNYTIANLLLRISDTEDLKKILFLLSDFVMHDWVIVISYYSMYMASLSAIAKIGFKSKSHAATITLLDYHYVHQKQKLETKHIEKLSIAYAISETLINKLMQSKTRRETAQYEATPAITKEMALTSLKDAEEFITKIEEILT